MGPLSTVPGIPAGSGGRWLRVEAPSAVAACRAAAQGLARTLAFPQARADQLALAVTEAASNLQKHARAGSLLLRACDEDGVPSIELVTTDAGPGVPDVPAVLRDGHSTAGSLGIGLGTISRLADFCDLYSVPGHGTTLTGRFWPTAQAASAVRYSGLTRPITGETECGDVYAAARTGDVLTAALCDGLGHGPLAAAAAREAMAAVFEEPGGEPAQLLERAHRRMSRTRGGALAIVQVAGTVVRFAGLGNIAAWILTDQSRHGLTSLPGIAGHRARSVRQFEQPLPPQGAVVLHSDGLTARWDIGKLPGLVGRDPLTVAAALLTIAGRHRDDAGVLAIRP